MFVLGHLGIGSFIAKPWRTGLPRRALLIGTLLPDLIDKPLYYLASAWSGEHGYGIITGTRTFGHTAIFNLTLASAMFLSKSKTLAALTLGVATHLLLDGIGDHFKGSLVSIPLLWPFTEQVFPIIPTPITRNTSEQFCSLLLFIAKF